MAKDHPTLTLREDLELALRRYLADGRRVILETVSRFFEPSSSDSKRPSTRKKSERRKPVRRIARRSHDELNTIGEKVVQALRMSPGASAAEVASALGLDKAQLLAPMLQLRAQGRIRKVGERTSTRYFPSTERNTRHGAG
jgi:predicted Rossmann fold nucleotide-binding protein DprA/Smf involved in DNA uptake